MSLPKVILVDIIHPSTDAQVAKKSMQESVNLVNTYGGVVIIEQVQKKEQADYRTFVGSGKLDEVIGMAIAESADYIIINNMLKPKQLFNIQWMLENDEKTKNIKVWDRIDLILKIFSKHASNSEAKLQIELAALRHMGPRIFGMGIEMSKQGGGIGTRGKGETNTEIMKRHLANEEQFVREKLKKMAAMREAQRKTRERRNFKSIAIVGYTNAGKSQLMNTLTKKDIKIKNELFATLDTRIGKLYLPESHSECLVSDTIGFIQKLPHDLIDAFKSTLNEAVHADLLLHVVDVSDPDYEMKIKIVEEILTELGATEAPVILVANKVDNLNNENTCLYTKAFEEKYKHYNPCFISALKKDGIPNLVKHIEKIVGSQY